MKDFLYSIKFIFWTFPKELFVMNAVYFLLALDNCHRWFKGDKIRLKLSLGLKAYVEGEELDEKISRD